MSASGNPGLSHGDHANWRALIIVLAILSLTISVATRTFGGTLSHASEVQSNATQTMRQHLDRDAFQWAPPVVVLTNLEPSTFYPHFAPAGPPLPNLLVDESLYNRPPPSF